MGNEIKTETEKENSLPFRVLDLTTWEGFFCGKILADLGFDVIKVERPGNSCSVIKGPFYRDKLDPENSLYHFAYNANKRGITLEIETRDGQEIFRDLVRKADVVIESFPAGYLDTLGLGYSSLKEINPRIIMGSITPFGTTGPYRDYKSSELINMAMSGVMNLSGDPDRSPVMVSIPHACLHGSAQAAVAILAACWYCQGTGKGQHIDISIRESVIQIIGPAISSLLISGVKVRRAGQFRTGWGPGLVRQIWPCRDGHVIFLFGGGSVRSRVNKALTRWMVEEGLASDFIREFDWDTFDMVSTTEQVIGSLDKEICHFFSFHGKSELFEEGAKRRVDIYPVNNCKEVTEQVQLRERDFWIKIDHPELETKITYPGPFVKSSEVNNGIRRKAPLAGEHNEEIYIKEMNLSLEELATLREAGIV